MLKGHYKETLKAAKTEFTKVFRIMVSLSKYISVMEVLLDRYEQFKDIPDYLIGL